MKKQDYIVNNIAAKAPYNLNFKETNLNFPELTESSSLNKFIQELGKQEFNSVEDLINQVARNVNNSLNYSVNGYQERPTDIQSIEFNPQMALKYADKVLEGGYGRCEDAGAVIRTVLKLILPEDYQVVPLNIESEVYDGYHDLTMVYSTKGKVVVDSIRYQGHEGGVFSEQDCPVNLVGNKCLSDIINDINTNQITTNQTKIKIIKHDEMDEGLKQLIGSYLENPTPTINHKKKLVK